MNNGVNEENKNSLGSNVVIAPAESYYDENGKVNENLVKKEEKVVPSTPAVNNTNVPVTPVVPLTQAVPVTPTPTEPVKEEKKEDKPNTNNVSTKKRITLTPLFVIIIFALIGLVVYEYVDKNRTLAELKYDCSQISNSDKKKELDINSNLVLDLYSKVKTNINEDVANNELNDEMKLYLAYRNLNVNDFYESNCNLFNKGSTVKLECDDNTFTPKAFSEESLQRSLKTLFGENTNIANNNIQLGNVCLGDYQYIEKRGEYVEGKCVEASTTSLKVNKSLKDAYREDNYLKITEEVKYIGNDKLTVPDYLKNGYYTYTFKINTNYNYSYVSKEYRSKY